MPRTSIPGPLHSRAEYDALVDEYRRLEGASEREALGAVVDLVVAQSGAGLGD